MLLTLLGLVDMFGGNPPPPPPPPTPSIDSTPTIFSKPDEGGRNSRDKEVEELDIILNQDNEDIAVILASWILNNN